MSLLNQRPSLFDGGDHVWISDIGDTSRFNLLFVYLILAFVFAIRALVVGILFLRIVLLLHFFLLAVKIDGF